MEVLRTGQAILHTHHHVQFMFSLINGLWNPDYFDQLRRI